MRLATPTDRTALGHVAFSTAFFGASAKVFFPDRQLFTEIWVEPYLNGVGCCNLVAETEGKVVGYIIGTCDLKAYQRYFVRALPLRVNQLFRGKYPQSRGCVPYLLRMVRYPAKGAPARDFPAQLHINLLPEVRGQNLGSKLLATYLECLARKGVRGVQLSTTRESGVAIRLYEKFGFTVWLEYESPLWRPWLGRDAVHVVMTKRL